MPPSSSQQPSPSPGQQQPRKSALKNDDDSERSPAVKAVHIADPEIIHLPSQSPEDASFRKQFTAGVARRLSGRLPVGSSRSSILSNASVEGLNSTASSIASPPQVPEDRHARSHHHLHRHSPQDHPAGHRPYLDRTSQRLVAQVAQWLQNEKAKKESRRKKRATPRRKSKSPPDGNAATTSGRARSGSIDSESSEVSLDRLQRIVDESMNALGLDPSSTDLSTPPRPGRRTNRHKRSKSSLQLHRAVSSDTDYVDGDVVVPSCDAILDNSKTMSYTGGRAGTDEVMTPGATASRREEKERQAWSLFKSEIVRLAHTLKLKGWRRVPLESGDGIAVERLSGALTNAVYVVSPPADLVAAVAGTAGEDGKKKKPPPKLLLRIYGPQVEQLIDREKELGVLKRLARKKIGPRLLGTFTNGRFEQYLNATTLTPPNLREPETSKMIAKRMKELHDGIELLESELADGPNVWVNWDNWVEAVERTVTYLDRKMLEKSTGSVKGSADEWKRRGLVCGVEWHVFKSLVERYRTHLNEYYGSPKKIREKLVFAHNDTQYGNILRIRPDDEKSPLLQPANEHKQLVVIDFEYAAANLPGLEFANHFTEWTYNYHDANAPHACTTSRYPTLEQQRRFVRAYVDHNKNSSRAGTPLVGPAQTPPMTSTNSIVDFMLDARVPPGGWKEEERKRDEAADTKVRELLEETRLWRPANSAQWVAWGIVQAKLPGAMARELEKERGKGDGEEKGEAEKIAEAAAAAGEEEEGEADEFDYLGYTRDRALFFLGDCVLMGLIKLEELPEEMRDQLKFVDY